MHSSFILTALTAATAASAAVIESRQSGSDVPRPGLMGFTNPALRGWNSAAARHAPCGGYKLMGRSEYPISGGQLSFSQAKDVNNVGFYYSRSAEPLSIADFEPMFSTNVSELYGGESCYTAPDFATLGASAGDPLTLMISYQSGPARTSFYQCADVTLVNNFNPANVNVECRNITLSTQTMRDSAALSVSVEEASASQTANAGSSGSSSTSSDSGLSTAAAGGIGAGVTLAVLAAIAGVLLALGKLSFSKRSTASTHEAGNDIRRVNSDSTQSTYAGVTEAKIGH